jgi:hypothetical protein
MFTAEHGNSPSAGSLHSGTDGDYVELDIYFRAKSLILLNSLFNDAVSTKHIFCRPKTVLVIKRD